MKENQEQSWQTHKNDSLDRELDTALAQYAAADPRVGLEERILAHLQYERAHAPARAWWRWGLAAACATVLFVVVGLPWTSLRRAPTIAIHPPAMQPKVASPAPQIASTRPPTPDSTAKPAPHRAKSAAPAYPKLDQFPSPQPLSDQEKFLFSYVAAYPEHAVLLARARTEALHRDQVEEMRSHFQGDGIRDWEDRNEDRNNK